MEYCNDRRLDGQALAIIRLGDVLSARAALKDGTAGGKDGTVSEIWKSIPYILVVFIWVYFRLRSEFGAGQVSQA